MGDLGAALGSGAVVEPDGSGVLGHDDHGPADELRVVSQGEDQEAREARPAMPRVQEQSGHDGDVGDVAAGILDPGGRRVVVRLRLGDRDLPDLDVIDDGVPAPDLLRVRQPRQRISDPLHHVPIMGVDPLQHCGEHRKITVLPFADGAR
ncbi:hypothetical protein Ae406Ps2_5641c [Pseudonocardia sp. Ae406_Ps2]|uniref:hypothetical protein n=1 Tax=unclassified Pseudonocardia TaxID=2619320 RepID=UPI00094ABF1C|nr:MULTISPECIES: hypothetical protein [unclassified Pseudonocardia]OLL96651.1 hypothetical protein Ae331Ps2_0318 [Pseudonocardia sp. Ae331_Ps2]OLM05641.1 hypothetical protein Ae406Ps2_5641c [Pseudonocardia sp. Ae406_Ps2]OLM15411.1 hypothetical protein Ae505Ps2_5543 [Pseudonocardia sp. Ae505_Ps2]OLM27216.1 hypothetical protein Ae706Ps2_5650c [Pseudonocardia sp. Ae706_Ps2]